MCLWNSMKISLKITVAIAFICLALTVALSLASIASIKELGNSSLNDKGKSLATITAETIKPAVQYNVSEDAAKVLEQLVSIDSDVSVAAVVIQDQKGNLSVSTRKEAKNHLDTDLSVPLKALVSHPPARKGETAMLPGSKLHYLAVKIDLTSNDAIQNGYLLLALNDTRLSSVLNTSSTIMAGLGLLLLCLGVGCAFLLANTLTKPLKTVLSVANALSVGDLRSEIKVTSNDEIGQLTMAMQSMVEYLRDMISKTVCVSNAIASASNRLESTSAQIASDDERVTSQTAAVATASSQMAATSAEISRNCCMASEASLNLSNAASSGEKVVQETIAGMSIIAERVHLASRTIQALGARSEQIGDVVGTIEEIADQTNLLALNAAIEAARAGDQGRGFAVVADEVRALAERTTRATREIGEMIKAIQNDTHNAVNAMDEGVKEVTLGTTASRKSGESLDGIMHHIVEVVSQINQIATAAEEQTATTNEVTHQVQLITNAVASTATGAVNTAEAAAQLALQAHDLQSLITRFRLT
jgi:methyl-accepting chemotaxis protein